jgi:hypothetical protein
VQILYSGSREILDNPGQPPECRSSPCAPRVITASNNFLCGACSSAVHFLLQQSDRLSLWPITCITGTKSRKQKSAREMLYSHCRLLALKLLRGYYSSEGSLFFRSTVVVGSHGVQTFPAFSHLLRPSTSSLSSTSTQYCRFTRRRLILLCLPTALLLEYRGWYCTCLGGSTCATGIAQESQGFTKQRHIPGLSMSRYSGAQLANDVLRGAAVDRYGLYPRMKRRQVLVGRLLLYGFCLRPWSGIVGTKSYLDHNIVQRLLP